MVSPQAPGPLIFNNIDDLLAERKKALKESEKRGIVLPVQIASELFPDFYSKFNDPNFNRLNIRGLKEKVQPRSRLERQ